MEGKPYIRMQVIRGVQYLAVARHYYGRLQILRSFGRYRELQNRKDAVNFLLEKLREYYMKRMEVS